MTFFSNNDEYWELAAVFLYPQLLSKSKVLAPKEFAHVHDGVMPYESLSSLREDFFDFVVVHKGMCQELGAKVIGTWVNDYALIFANEVFVIFSRSSEVLIDDANNHYRSLIGQLESLPQLPVNIQIGSEALLDYMNVVQFFDGNFINGQTVIAPYEMSGLFCNADNKEVLLNETEEKFDWVIVSVLSVPKFSFENLMSVVSGYTLAYSDNYFSVYSGSKKKKINNMSSGCLHEALKDSAKQNKLDLSYDLYRYMLLGE
jgi:hypothetical protein